MSAFMLVFRFSHIIVNGRNTKRKTIAEENAKVKDIDHRNLIIPFYPPQSHNASPSTIFLVFPLVFRYFFNDGFCCVAAVVYCIIGNNIKCS